MKRNCYIFSLVVITVLITGCQSSLSNNSTRLCLNDKGIYHRCGTQVVEPQIKEQKTWEKSKQEFQALEQQNSDPDNLVKNFQPINFKLISDYVEQMVMGMQKSLAGQKLYYPVAVASFVNLDSSLNNTNPLGNQIAEAFITELQKVSLPVVDHRITGAIKVTQSGDFVFSRNPDEYKTTQKIGYVVSGTMIRSDNGIIINARMVGLKSNLIIASSKVVLPNLLINRIL